MEGQARTTIRLSVTLVPHARTINSTAPQFHPRPTPPDTTVVVALRYDSRRIVDCGTHRSS